MINHVGDAANVTPPEKHIPIHFMYRVNMFLVLEFPDCLFHPNVVKILSDHEIINVFS